MKKYLTEVIVLPIQLFMFYIFPLFAGPTDAMGMVLLIIFETLLLSIILGSVSDNWVKLLCPVAIAVLFLPTVPIYYNETALVHSVWYFVISSAGLLPATLIRFLICRRWN